MGFLVTNFGCGKGTQREGDDVVFSFPSVPQKRQKVVQSRGNSQDYMNPLAQLRVGRGSVQMFRPRFRPNSDPMKIFLIFPVLLFI